MSESIGTYDSPKAKNIALAEVLAQFAHHGAAKIYVKRLAPNDNSKNQPYFGGHLSELAFLPTGELEGSNTVSRKTVKPGRKIKYQAPLNLSWMSANGELYKAPNAKLIYYPQYPEVRFSGFLRSSKVKISEWMDPNKFGRTEGRWLLLGVSSENKIYAYLVTPSSDLSQELESTATIPTASVFGQISKSQSSSKGSTRAELLSKLKEIHDHGWVSGITLDKNGSKNIHNSPNGGGTTLEALLGIIPNSIAEPDYLGWEVKQYGVKEFSLAASNATTLMTPEPDGGLYSTGGAESFVRKFGYPDKKGVPDRLNFSSPHRVGKLNSTTGLILGVTGFDAQTKTITDANGAIELSERSGSVAASWSFPKLMSHWKCKHSQAVFVPCCKRAITRGKSKVEYCYGDYVQLGVGTDFELLLSSFSDRSVFHDPGCKLEKASSPKSKVKGRNQIRVAHKNLKSLYRKFEEVDLD